jgi:hypothetical protein
MTGFEGVVAACLVAVKQNLPENEVVLLGVIKFRAKVLVCQQSESLALLHPGSAVCWT